MDAKTIEEIGHNLTSAAAAGDAFVRVRPEALASLLAIARAARADAWVPVAERLPEEGVRVLLLFNDGSCELGRRDGDAFANFDWHSDIAVTEFSHWQPLPERPQLP